MPLLPIEFHCRRRNITRKHQRSLLRFAFQAGPPWKNQSLCVRLVWFATPDKFPFAFIEGCKKIGRNNIEFIYLHQFTVLFSTLKIKPEPRQKRVRRLFSRFRTLAFAAIFQSASIGSVHSVLMDNQKPSEDWWLHEGGWGKSQLAE